MNKIYCYAALLVSCSFLFRTLKANNYLLTFLVTAAILLISAKLYKFQDGKKLKDTYQKLPIVKLLAFVFRDKHILTSQNVASLKVLMLSSAYTLSMLISFYLFGHSIKHFLILIGCISFSFIFTKLLLTRYV